MPSKSLTQLAFERLKATPIGLRCFEESREIVVFGSRSFGLERADSDIDILCIGELDFRLKTTRLDLIAMPVKAITNMRWLGSELASHIVEYGTWIKGTCRWRSDVHLGNAAVENKRRRIAAFMRALPDAWITLDECFRRKYATKLRRETQRLLLMERGTPIPPTKILDSFWDSFSRSPFEVRDRLNLFTCSRNRSFTEDLFARIDAALYLADQLNMHSHELEERLLKREAIICRIENRSSV
jgi:hypothetical protein